MQKGPAIACSRETTRYPESGRSFDCGFDAIGAACRMTGLVENDLVMLRGCNDFSSALSDRDRVDTPHPAQGSPLQTVTQENRVGSTSMPTRQQLKELRDAMMELMDAMKTFVEKIDEVTENY